VVMMLVMMSVMVLAIAMATMMAKSKSSLFILNALLQFSKSQKRRQTKIARNNLRRIHEIEKES
jgi:hypothetical protein